MFAETTYRPTPAQERPSEVGDLRFRALLTTEQWAALPLAVRRRFAKRLQAGDTVVYTGTVVEARTSRIGWALAQLCRMIGGPLPTATDTGVASVVTVTEDARTGGQVWTRLYARRDGFPQTIHSAKRFAGETGLEEHVGARIGMSLKIAVEDGALVFRQHRYFLALGARRMRLPGWLTPGALTVKHIDLGRGRFAFTLDIAHPRFGPLIHQRVEFQDAPL